VDAKITIDPTKDSDHSYLHIEMGVLTQEESEARYQAIRDRAEAGRRERMEAEYERLKRELGK
jgi:hypothetical protein